jgi:6-pyruvoyl-tetrahydropterin synthase related domain
VAEHDAIGAAAPVDEVAGDPPPAPAFDAAVAPVPSGRRARHRAAGPDLSSHLPAAATAIAVLGVIAVTLWQLHLNLLLSNTTTTGGDTGAHFMMPAFLRSSLLSHGSLTGWSPAWYAGYPIYTFYFVLPDLIAALGSFIAPYDIAFKLVTVLGSVTLPVAAWACGRLFRLRAPGPAALAAATLPFLFDYTWTIYGGNLFSTLAGEYAYSLSLTLAVLFIGLFARGLRTGRGRFWSAAVLALCILSHIVPALLALGAAAVLIVFELVPARFWVHDDPPETAARAPHPVRWGISTAAIGVALSGWWLVPFGLLGAYSTQMGYSNVHPVILCSATDPAGGCLLPRADVWVLVLAAIAVVVALIRRSRFGLLFSVLGIASGLAVQFDPQGALYNVRLLPLWFICVYLLAGWLFGVFALAVANAWRAKRATRWASGAWQDRLAAVGSDPEEVAHPAPAAPTYRFAPAAVFGPLAAILAACIVVVPPFVLPASALPSAPGANQVSYWAAWNYTGYEGKPAYKEFQAVIGTMEGVGRQYGCGRAMWEYNANENRFGTPEALMLLPYFTGGCIDSMEGLLFESATTTPYHFVNQSELSLAPSDPMVGLPYDGLDVPLGIEHLQQLGVRYFMAFSPAVVEAALVDPSLTLVASTGPWKSLYGADVVKTTWDIFKVKSSSLVTPLANKPAVLTGVGPAQATWLPVSLAWYDDPTAWKVELAAGGPPDWPRVTAGGATHPPVEREPAARVSRIVETNDTISFHVNRLGTPVLVKTSYFPDWKATGAQGPWRATPNSMVVVPTAHTVTLTYGTSGPQELGKVITGLGVLALVALAGWSWWRRRRRRSGGVETGPGRRGAVEPLR